MYSYFGTAVVLPHDFTRVAARCPHGFSWPFTCEDGSCTPQVGEAPNEHGEATVLCAVGCGHDSLDKMRLRGGNHTCSGSSNAGGGEGSTHLNTSSVGVGLASTATADAQQRVSGGAARCLLGGRREASRQPAQLAIARALDGRAYSSTAAGPCTSCEGRERELGRVGLVLLPSLRNAHAQNERFG